RAGMADTRSASRSTIMGDLPPSSSDSFLRFPLAAATICFPIAVDPVKLSLSTPGWEARAAPAVEPIPGITLTTPGGTPASTAGRHNASGANGASSDGLRMQVQPAARAGANFIALPIIGAFHDVISAATPIGSLRV